MTKPTVAGLLAAQEAATEEWLIAVELFRRLIDKIDFPLGFPIQGEEMEDIQRKIMEWSADFHSRETLEWMARDIVAVDEYVAGQTSNEQRRIFD